ncbi:hypothetical protein BDP27DRAFT_1309858 [Rhodocollybia butyracea]|uniref:DUF6534 domain-containing protein n=1 Tax=Rhodocollybia butyracea TaxID=206335 RepID=A0A9P5UGL3_9AGAR|nr:hypothetical protein BDP27DRAFT_1309858 [Rhodocollybia butyracea]
MAPTVPITIDNTFGALLVGFGVSCCLFGVSMAQMSSYFSRYHADKPFYKFMVITILVCQLTDQILIGHVGYYYIIQNFTNARVFLEKSVTWSFILQQTLGAFVGSLVTSCYALRVWRFSGKNWVISGFLIVLSLAHLGSGLVFTVKAFALPSVSSVIQLKTIGTASLALGASSDILTAASLCYFLRRLRTGQAQSDSIANTLMIYAVGTGGVTSVVSISCLILFNLMPMNLIFISVFFVLSKVYGISFMATLNTRRIVRGRGTDRQNTSTQDISGVSIPLSSRTPRSPLYQSFGTGQRPEGVWISVTESEEDVIGVAK